MSKGYDTETVTVYKLEIKRVKNIIRLFLFGVFIIVFNFTIAKDAPELLVAVIDILLILSMVNSIFEIVNINKKIKKIKKDKQKSNPFSANNYANFEKLFDELLKEQQRQQRQRQQQSVILSTEKIDNAYKLLKLSKTDSIEKIKKVYRELAIKWHPDKWSTDTPENQKIAERNFQKLQGAYELIKKDKNIV